ncbi:hypothetical protein VSS74_25110 [Conexibacter stalactiti]|uniref:Uncharacterized protein n=1 Tax=Conexibacter stalactiti TaxID=1940611 RepID=A0ABU4HWE7_9ACTN|nr:hypothetical protein [Conexibacter stalactiti]MDW5597655.1 hypothetical protein [Conexibacter stalactiti]MEC5038297.1 hypothetical protein [Conexibacter stalactiti]
MAIYNRGVPVRVIDDGVAVTLTAERLAADVVEQVGGASAITGPPGPTGEAGAPGAGVPAGGVPGQLLAKSGSADYATGWVAAPAAGGAAATAALRRLGSGSGEAAAGERAAGFAVSGATRPSGYAVVIWTGGSPPAGAVAGDIWIRTS